MKYEEMKSLAFASGYVPDGYFGDMARVLFSFNQKDGNVYVVCDHGYYKSVLPPSTSKEEAFFMLRKHNLTKNYRNIAKVINQRSEK